MVSVVSEERFSILVSLFWMRKSFCRPAREPRHSTLAMWLKERSRNLREGGREGGGGREREREGGREGGREGQEGGREG